MRVPVGLPQFVVMDFPFSWMCEVREKYGAKHPYGYWVTGGGSVSTREQVVKHLRIYYPHIEVLSVRRQKQPPECKLIKMLPTHYQYGLNPRYKTPMDQFSDPAVGGNGGQNYDNILVPVAPKLEGIRVAKIEPITLKPIGLKPLLGVGSY